MRRDEDMHLDSQRISVSLVDMNDLTQPERDHLEHCMECSEERRLLAGRLDSLSEQAARFTPVSELKIKLPASETVKPSTWHIRWPLGAVAALASVALVIALVLPLFFPGTAQHGTQTSLKAQMAKEEMIMAEVQQIDDNSFAAAYAGILPSGASGMDDDAFDYMDPMETMPDALPDVMDI
jgi:hypothetical protein